MSILLTFNALAVGAETREPPPQITIGLPADGLGDDRRPVIPQGQLLEDAARNAPGNRKPSSPEIKPRGWFSDYDYQSTIDGYLRKKYRNASNSNKSTYVYLYADWYEACLIFRKSAQTKNYAEMFSTNQIVMLDYNFFRKKFDIQAKYLPMILKVNENGILGPELVYPVTGAGDHPRKIYHKLKKFFKSNAQATLILKNTVADSVAGVI
jgi:hypothetical protein